MVENASTYSSTEILLSIGYVRGLQGGTVGTKDVLDSNPNLGSSCRALDVLSTYSSFLLQSTNKTVRSNCLLHKKRPLTRTVMLMYCFV